jgi:signal transduction histidine kinase
VPAIVVVLGTAVSAAITLFGVTQLQQQSDSAAALHAKVLAVTLAERLRATPRTAMKEVADRVAERAIGEVLIVTQDGQVEHDASVETPSKSGILELLSVGVGETYSGLGRSRFHVARLRPPHENLAVIVMISAPDKPFASSSLVESAAAFTVALVSIGALVAFYLARSVQSDVRYVRDRILGIAQYDGEPVGQPIVVRAVDQVGRLTVAFNRLIERYYQAEQDYRNDLAKALSYERERSDFLAALSHELRTPLNVILGFTDVLLSEVDGPLSHESRENLLIVRQSGHHLRSLISDILDFSGLESGRVNLTLDRTDVFQIAADVVKEKRLAAERKNLDISLEGVSVMAVADQLRVRQILGNLVSNAVKFTSQGGIQVTVEPHQNDVAVTVKDTGPGIAAEDQAAVFEEYRQAGDLRARGSGTGLGLAITRRLVRMHGGRIELSSQLGIGSRFTVLLPLGGPPSQNPADQSAPRGNTLQLPRAAFATNERGA